MAGLSLKCGDCGALLRSVEEAQEHAELTSHSNFSESTEAVLNLVCAACGKPCRSKTESDLHTKRTGHTEFTDKTLEAAKPISLEAPKVSAESEDAGDESASKSEEMVVPEVDKNILGELEAMGFPTARATRALFYSGNASLEAAVNWVVEHENDPEIDQMPLVPKDTKVEAQKPSLTPEQLKAKQQELRERARKKKEEEEKIAEREREKERIRIGKELLEAKRIEEENERKRIMALRKAEKEEEKRARDKIRQKLEEDKAERRRRLGLPPEDPSTAKPSAPVVEEKKISLPVRPASKAEQMRECLRLLKSNHKEDDAKVKRAFQTLLTYVGNVARSPDEEKFRKIRLSNQTFQVQSLETHFIDLIHASNTAHKLRQIHAQLFRCNIFSSSRVVTQFISSCSSLNLVDYAISIFQRFEMKNSFLFNALIRGLAENSRFEGSIYYFVLMLKWKISPDRLTFPFVLKSAAALSSGGVGRALHGGILKFGLEFDSFVRVSLVDMYVKVEDLSSALKVFDESPDRIKNGSVLIWNVLIHGYCRVGDLVKATELFETMPKKDTGSWNSLINGFMRKGDLGRAKELFERMPEKNVVSWTTMVNGFSQNGDPEKALETFSCMLEEGAQPNDYTIVSALSACAKVGALDAGLRIHNYLSSNGFRLNLTIGTALVDMYAKCGNIESAGEVFCETKEKGLLTWSVMIWGWAIHGHFKKAILYFEWMKSTGMKPDGVVFLAVLTSCSHSGKVNDGLKFFDSMRRDYLIEPSMKHYTLVVDMLGRAGRLDEALNFIRNMPINPDFVVWGALFCACRAHKNIEMAELASEKLLELEPKHPGSYVFLSNAYAAVGRWDDAERVRISMRDRGAQKDPGWSFIEVDDKLHRFVAGDKTHNRAREIYSRLDEISAGAREKGYTSGIECVLHNIEEEEKEDALGHHSEKLALAFGLISTTPGTTIRIVKNLRVCVDCHSFMKYASKMNQREIVLRDIKRFHHFKDGDCSCGDYW